MNKTYRHGYTVPLPNDEVKFVRLSRSIPRRSAYKVFYKKSPAPHGMFLAFAPENLLYLRYETRRYSFYYKEEYAKWQEHLWKLNHGKFKTFPKNYITEDYKFRCRRAAC